MSGFDQWRGSRRGVGCLGFLVALGCGCGYAPKTGRTTFNGQDAATRAQQPGPQDASATTAAEPASPRIELADTVRLAEDRLYLLGEQRGLVAFDVSDIDRPREVWTVPVAGDPLALFVRKGVAILVIAAGFESRTSRSYLRVMDVLAARPPVVRQELPVSGSVRDVHALGDVFYALSEVGSDPATSSVVLSSFRLEDGTLREQGSIRVAGATPSFAVGTTKIALACRTGDAQATEVTFVEVGPGGALSVHGSLRVPGSVPPRLEPQLAAGERFARLVTSLPADSPPVLSVVDARDPDAPRLVAQLALPSGRGIPAGVFDGDRLYVVENPGLSLGDGTSALSVVDLAGPDAPRLLGSVRLPGSLSNVIPLGDRALVIASRGTPASAMHVLVHAIDVTQGKPPALLGSTEFGETWTATVAATQPAIAVDDAASTWLALPFSTWREDARRYANGVEVFRRTPHGFEDWGAVRAAGWIERVLFVRGRFVGVTAAGLTVVDALHAGRSILWPVNSSPGERSLK